MSTYLVRIYLPVYYDLEASNAQEAEAKAIARFRTEQKTVREPTVEVLLDDGIATGFWDVVDSQIDDYKERFS